MTSPSDFTFRYSVTVRGITRDSRMKINERFPGATGGANPETLEPYHTVHCDCSEMESVLTWLCESIQGQTGPPRLTIGVESKLGWVNVQVPADILALANRFGAEIHVSFASTLRTDVRGAAPNTSLERTREG
jgi:hypothetical protein